MILLSIALLWVAPNLLNVQKLEMANEKTNQVAIIAQQKKAEIESLNYDSIKSQQLTDINASFKFTVEVTEQNSGLSGLKLAKINIYDMNRTLVFTTVASKAKLVGGITDFRYLIFEVFDHYQNDPPRKEFANASGIITEIEIYDASKNLISYIPTENYDSYTNGVSICWEFWGGTNCGPATSGAAWSKWNLNDRQFVYNNNLDGNYNSTAFLGGAGDSGYWARFVTDMGSVRSIKNITVYLGSPEGRVPKKVTVYGTNSYSYNSNLKNRQDTGLIKLGTIEPPYDLYTVKPFTIDLGSIGGNTIEL